MNNKNLTIPEIRFKDFNNEWSNSNIIDMVDFYRGHGLSWNDIKSNGKNKCILYGNLYTDYGMVIDNVIRKTNENSNNYLTSEIGDVLIPSSDTTPIGLARASAIEEKGVILGGDINVLRPKEMNGAFLSYCINKNKSELIKRIKGTTVRHLNNSDIKDVNLIVTDNKKEQEKISKLLKYIDNLISLQQVKHDKLLNFKNSMLIKMFPQKTSTIPEIRFKDFNDDWELKEFNKFAKYRNGKAHEGDICENGKYIVVNSKFCSTNGEIKKYSNKQNEPLFKNEIAFVLSDVPNGRALARTFLINENNKYTLNQRIAAITPFEEIDPYYLFILMNRNNYFLQFDDGAKQTNLSTSDVYNFIEKFPNKKEQEKIGELFKQIDSLIDLHQFKIDKLKYIKVSMLSKLFV